MSDLIKQTQTMAKKRAEELLVIPRDSLLPQYFRSLRARANYLKSLQGGQNREILDAVIQRIEDEKEPSWGQAFELEMDLVRATTDKEHLSRELKRRLAEARKRLESHRAAYYESVNVRELDSLEDMRTLLIQLLDDLQWHYNKMEFKRQNIRLISRSINEMVIWMFGLSALVIVLVIRAKDPGPGSLGPLAAMVGGMGAAFSMLVTIRDKLEKGPYEETVRVRMLFVLFSRLLIGVVGGSILYFFLQAGYLSGDFFPDPNDLAGEGPDRIKYISGLILWSLVAGFSESLVPGLLNDRDKKARLAQE